MSMRTPLSRVRGLGSAGEGTGHFWKQRLTGVANVPLVLGFVWFVICGLGSTQAEFAARVSSPLVAAKELIGLRIVAKRLLGCVPLQGTSQPH